MLHAGVLKELEKEPLFKLNYINLICLLFQEYSDIRESLLLWKNQDCNIWYWPVSFYHSFSLWVYILPACNNECWYTIRNNNWSFNQILRNKEKIRKTVNEIYWPEWQTRRYHGVYPRVSMIRNLGLLCVILVVTQIKYIFRYLSSMKLKGNKMFY